MVLEQSFVSSIPLLDLKKDLSQVELICIYGIGEGSVYRQLRSWLHQQEQRFLLFIEDEEEYFLKAKEASWSKDPKVRLFFYQEGHEEMFKEIGWEFLFLQFSFFAQPEYVEKKGEKMLQIFSEVEHYHRGIDLLASDFQDMGAAVLKNIVGNQKRLAHSLLGQSLEGMCRGIPAIVCGAGPSLNHQIPLLSSLSDKGLLLAGGSAVTALSKQGLSPHLCAHFDPHPPRFRFLEHDAYEIPHFYQSRFSSSLLDCVHAPLLWIAEGGHYPIERWFKERYGITYPSFDAGWTAANFCTALALVLGCNPIIFVGMEFSCPADSFYASGMEGSEHQDKFLQVHTLEGNPLMTKNDWMMSAEWLGALAHKHPDVCFVNATSQGLTIPHVNRLSLDEACHHMLQKEFDLLGIVHACVQRAQKPSICAADAEVAVQELIESYMRCDKSCDALLSQWEKYYPGSPLERGEYAAMLHDLEKEVAFQMVLDPLWQIWKRPILRASNHPLGQHLHRLLFFKRAIEANVRAIS